jgi:hypothetical protein
VRALPANLRFGLGTPFVVVAALVTLALPTTASAAITGRVEGVAVDPSLTRASVQNLSAGYAQCAEEQSEELVCSWAAVAMLVPPWDSVCPANSAFELAPGLPGRQPDATRVWSESASADGTLESGPLTFPLDDVDDEHLCLYVVRDVEAGGGSPSTPERGYVPLVMTSELVASDLLHVDLPPTEPSPPTNPTLPAGSTSPPTCKKRQVRRHGKCVNRKHRRKHRHRQDRSH